MNDIMDTLATWDGFSDIGQAAYDAQFELEKEQANYNSKPYECPCGFPKYEMEEYCGGDVCNMD